MQLFEFSREAKGQRQADEGKGRMKSINSNIKTSPFMKYLKIYGFNIACACCFQQLVSGTFGLASLGIFSAATAVYEGFLIM